MKLLLKLSLDLTKLPENSGGSDGFSFIGRAGSCTI